MANLLLIDDSPTMIMSLSRILQKDSHTIATAANGQDALDKIAAGTRPDLILADINMPVMDGLTFIRAARRTAAVRFTPILVLTTESGAAKRAEARSAGASGWLVKPAQPVELLETIKRLLPRG
jgi:two-component system chemotaxis response regulator CheY